MRQEILDILTTYGDLIKKPYEPTRYQEAMFVPVNFPNRIVKQLNLDATKYKVEGSVGVGGWTHTPWVSVFDREITETAQKGFYIVYLFRKDMRGLYLSLNQGTTYIDKKYKGLKPRNKMETIALNLRQNLTYSSNLSLEKIDLVANTPNAKNYMAAHICGKYYPLTSLPTDIELVNDLREMIELYKQLEGLTSGRTIEETLDFYLQQEEIEDTQFQNDILVAPPARTLREPQQKPSINNIRNTEAWKRDPSIAKEALEQANYLCEVDPNHQTFISEVTRNNFVEAHHLIPIKNQDEYNWSLDVPGNIISLCPNCHREIHHANKQGRRLLIKQIFEKKQTDLSVFGLAITLSDLYKSYGC